MRAVGAASGKSRRGSASSRRKLAADHAGIEAGDLAKRCGLHRVPVQRQRVEDRAGLNRQFFRTGLVPARERIEHGAELRQYIRADVRFKHGIQDVERARVAARKCIERGHAPGVLVEQGQYATPRVAPVAGQHAQALHDLLIVEFVQSLDAKEVIESGVRIARRLGIARCGRDQHRPIGPLQNPA